LRDKLTILKLGGSVVTEKNKPLTPNIKAIKRLAEEIHEADFKPLIIIHGGGSYGHPLAKKYNIPSGLKDYSQRLGFSETHEAMVNLNSLIIRTFLEHGIPAFGFAPSSFIITEKGRIHVFDLKALMMALEIDLIPVLYGDAVFDNKLGFTILSGDQIAAFLAVKLGARRIIMGIDVDGVYDSDPKRNPSARLIPELSLRNLEKLMKKIGGSQAPDVTGGMMGKMLELKVAVERGIDVLIVNALLPGNIYKALIGEKVVGTRIRR